MSDLSHQWGSDLSFGAAGDVALKAGPDLGQQRILRRLLTNALDYMWHPTYGAGLPAFVGTPTNVLQIKSVIRGQIFKETYVAQSPAPIINVTSSAGGVVGNVYVQILYADAQSGQSQTLIFSLDT